MFRVKRTVSKGRWVVRFSASLSLIAESAAGSRANFSARSSYSEKVAAISSGNSNAVSRLAETRPAKVVPGTVMSGSPAHRASLAVVCAQQGSVSRNKSARAWRPRCFSGSARGANTRRAGSISAAAATRFRLAVAASFESSSQRTLPSLFCSRRIHVAKTSRVILAG